MNLSVEKFKELLVAPGHVGADDFARAAKDAADAKKDLWDSLLDLDLIKDHQLGQLVAESLGFKFFSIENEKIDEEVFTMIPELVAKNKGVIAIARQGDKIRVAMTDPADLETKNLIQKRLVAPIDILLVTKNDLLEVLNRYRADYNKTIQNTVAELKGGKLGKEARDQNVISLVDNVLQYAFVNHASDIHIDPTGEKSTVRFRIDGILHDIEELPTAVVDLFITRIKILSKLRTDEHRSAQDGKLQFEVERGELLGQKSKAEKVDVRVSVVPTVKGENVVMRILSAENQELFLEDLGLDSADMKKVKKAIDTPVGMVLVTGPTGSGKTTTLYSILKILNKREVNIATIEDPVEYSISGVTQIQVNPKTNLTFANGLRSIVRQDPNIIMVGEIRDEETAGIAVNAAMTGHLVLSTLHTNDSATTLPRLSDMGVEPFLVASTVRVVVAQRLVRKICSNCRESNILTDDERAAIDNNPTLKESFERLSGKTLKTIRVYRGGGCKVCSNTGYRGRLGIFEVLEMGEKIKSLIMKRADSDAVIKQAVSDGMTPMFDDGIKKVLNGTTTLQEVLRVTTQ